MLGKLLLYIIIFLNFNVANQSCEYKSQMRRMRPLFHQWCVCSYVTILCLLPVFGINALMVAITSIRINVMFSARVISICSLSHF